MTKTIEFRGASIPIVVDYHKAMFVFKNMGLDLLRIFEGEETIMTIMSNDGVMVNIWYYYVQDHCESLEDAIKTLDPASMNVFRDIFWEEVVNFTPSPMRKLAQGMWKEVKKGLQSPEEILKSSSLDSSEGLE